MLGTAIRPISVIESKAPTSHQRSDCYVSACVLERQSAVLTHLCRTLCVIGGKLGKRAVNEHGEECENTPNYRGSNETIAQNGVCTCATIEKAAHKYCHRCFGCSVCDDEENVCGDEGLLNVSASTGNDQAFAYRIY